MRFLKTLIIFSYLFLFFNNKVFAENMISLNEFYQKHSLKDGVAVIYGLERCSALFGLISRFAPTEDKINYIIASSIITTHAIKTDSYINKRDIKKSEKKILSNIDKLQNLYDEDYESIFNKTGSKFGGYIKDDIDVCNILHNGLKQK